MKEELKILWKLQKLDTKISELESRQKSIPQEIRQANKKLQSKENEFQKEKEVQENLITQRKKLEQEVDGLKDKVRRHKSQLLQVKTNREYQSLLQEINTEQAKISAYEEEILDILGQSDELSRRIESISKELEKEKAKFTNHQKKLQEELSRVNSSLIVKRDESKDLSKNISRPVLSRYEQIKRGRGGIGVVGISGYTCEGCNAILPPQFVAEVRKGNKLLACEQCGRILIWEDDIV